MFEKLRRFFGCPPDEVPLPDYGCLMPLKDFKECVDCEGFLDYDGEGYYATETSMVQDRRVDLSNLDTKYTHVIWFNK